MITDEFLKEVAKHINGETGIIPNHLAVGTGSISNFESTRTDVEGEIRSREALTSSRTNNDVTFTAISSGADVIDTINGDTITNAATFATSSGGVALEGIVINGVTQTTAFDIEHEFVVQTRRV